MASKSTAKFQSVEAVTDHLGKATLGEEAPLPKKPSGKPVDLESRLGAAADMYLPDDSSERVSIIWNGLHYGFREKSIATC